MKNRLNKKFIRDRNFTKLYNQTIFRISECLLTFHFMKISTKHNFKSNETYLSQSTRATLCRWFKLYIYYKYNTCYYCARPIALYDISAHPSRETSAKIYRKYVMVQRTQRSSGLFVCRMSKMYGPRTPGRNERA